MMNKEKNHSFSDMLLRGLVTLNPALGPGPLSWILEPGMGFSDTAFWWGICNTRPRPHEGVDFFSFRRTDGSTGRIDESTRIPLALPGTLMAKTEDFLGSSLWFCHPDKQSGTDILFSAYAHLRPQKDLVTGERYPAGTLLGVPTLANTPQTKTPPHLHVSTFYAPATLDIIMIDWSRITEQTAVKLIDPLSL